MRKLKMILTVVLTVTFVITSTATAFAANPYANTSEAESLKELGLFADKNNGLALGDSITREEGIVLVLDFFSLSEEARELSDTDVTVALAKYKDKDRISDWARQFVAYAIKNKLSVGTGANIWEPKQKVDGNTLAAWALAEMGYKVTFTTALEQLIHVDGTEIPPDYMQYNNKKIDRDVAVGILFGLLSSNFADGSGTVMLKLLANASMVQSDYYKKTVVSGNLEKKYTALGSYETAYAEYRSNDERVEKYEIWYPRELESSNIKYPVVFVANGTGLAASSYKAFFKHLASWGFIVVGNEDMSSRTGASSESSLMFLLELNKDSNSIFHGKVDTDHIGIGGHSQGGVGAINAVTSQNHGNMYKALYAVSATSPYWGQENIFGLEWSYDLSKVHIPTFLSAGTGSFDAGTAEDITATEGQGITPLWSLRVNYKALPDSVAKITARKTDVDHGETYLAIDGYMTAWFMWHLQEDEEAGKAFKGNDAEILHNSLYQDIQSNIH